MRKYGRYDMKIVLSWKNPQKIPSFFKITKEGLCHPDWFEVMINAAKKNCGWRKQNIKSKTWLTCKACIYNKTVI